MRRLLKIGFDQALLSLTPILSWFLLSLLVNKDVINVYAITYPIQFIYGALVSLFSISANISRLRDKNPDAAMSGMVAGIVFSVLIYGYFLLNIDGYITFMNADPATYRVFTIYSIINLFVQTVFAFILNKLYYQDENSRANRYSMTFNILNFGLVVGMALITKNQYVIVGVTSIIMLIYVASLVVANWEKFHFRLNPRSCFRYDSANLVSATTSFFIQLFGISHVMNFGAQYGLAVTFVSLVTDTQWDILEASPTLAKVDISYHRFNYKQSLRNAYKLLTLLMISSSAMFFCLYRFYDLDLGLTLLYFALELCDFFISPRYYINTAFLQLNWSSGKVATNKFIARLSRLACTFLPTPFCNNIGALTASLYQAGSTRLFLRRNFVVTKTGRVIRRPARTTRKLRKLAYDDIVIDE